MYSSLGKICLLEIDLVGVTTVRARGFKSARFVFIEPPSFAELERRLRKRNTETPEVVSKHRGIYTLGGPYWGPPWGQGPPRGGPYWGQGPPRGVPPREAGSLRERTVEIDVSSCSSKLQQQQTH